MEKKFKNYLAVTVIVLIVAALSVYSYLIYKPAATNNDSEIIGMANPASVNCKNLGGNLVIQKKADSSEYGLCNFEDNRACEEWALFRGDCPMGGVKTTGFDTIDQKYCAWLGGQTLAVPQSVCTLKNGAQCSTESLYSGQGCLAE